MKEARDGIDSLVASRRNGLRVGAGAGLLYGTRRQTRWYSRVRTERQEISAGRHVENLRPSAA